MRLDADVAFVIKSYGSNDIAFNKTMIITSSALLRKFYFVALNLNIFIIKFPDRLKQGRSPLRPF